MFFEAQSEFLKIFEIMSPIVEVHQITRGTILEFESNLIQFYKISV